MINDNIAQLYTVHHRLYTPAISEYILNTAVIPVSMEALISVLKIRIRYVFSWYKFIDFTSDITADHFHAIISV